MLNFQPENLIDDLVVKAVLVGMFLLIQQPNLADCQTKIQSKESTVVKQAGSGDSASYEEAYRSHQKLLRELAEKCEELKKPKLAEFTRRWIRQRDPSREYFFVLPFNRSLKLPEIDDRVSKFWLGYFNQHNAEYSKKLFELAEKDNTAKNYEAAYRLLHECLFHDPDHQGALKILGVEESEFKVKGNAYRRRDKLHPEGEIVKYESDHFQLFTALDAKTAKSALAKFERWYIVWRQMFYDYWAPSSWLSRRFDKGAAPIRRSKKFKVVMYASRDEYIRKLKPVSPGIEVSVGYYLFSEKTSYFYLDKESNETTWVHELTHQFMHETIPVSSRSEIRKSLWAVEGIAMYMESLIDFGTCVTLGGEDAERLNFCRYNYFRRGFFVDMSRLNEMSQREIVESGSVKGLYSLSAAYCHFLLRTDWLETKGAAEKRKTKAVFLKFLQMVHQGKKADLFFERLASQVSFDKGFREFLQPRKERLIRSLIAPQRYRILYLGNSGIGDETLSRIQGASKLETLDLSGTKVSDKGLVLLSQLKNLRYLSLEKTQVTDDSMPMVGKLGNLEELDLTTTAITDDGLKMLGQLDELVALWIAGTRVSDRSIETIQSLPALKQLDLRKSGVSNNGRKRLNPRIKLVD